MTNISDFDIFARVARTGNMSAAGREIGISPAVVSKRISLLEERLGTRLFQRTTRQLSLTETGEGYFKRVLEILSLVTEADDFVSSRSTRPGGHLKVTAPTVLTRLRLAPRLASFLELFPDIDVDLQLSDNYVDIVREGFDLAIRMGELSDSSLVARKLAVDERVICAAPAYIAREGEPTTLADLARHNCLSAGAQKLWRLAGPDGEQQVRVKGSLRSNSAEFVRAALLAGLGIGLRSRWEVGPDIESGALKIVLPEYRGSSKIAVYAVYPTRDYLPAKVNAFIEFVSRELARDVSGAVTEPDRRRPAARPRLASRRSAGRAAVAP